MIVIVIYWLYINKFIKRSDEPKRAADEHVDEGRK